MACKRKKTSQSKFEYIFRSVVPQERKGKGFVLLCSQAGDFWSKSGDYSLWVHDEVWLLDSYSSVCMRSAEVLSCTNTAAPPWNELSAGAVSRSLKEVWRCCGFWVLLAGILPKQGCLPREMEIPESALDFAVSVHGQFPNPHSQLWLAARFGTNMQASSLLVSHFEQSCSFLPLKDSPTFHVHATKLYLTCNLKPKMPWYKALLQ